MSQLIAIIVDRPHNSICNKPVFFDKITLMNKVSAKGKTDHIGTDKWVLQFSKSKDYISTRCSDQIIRMIEKSYRLGE